ncbi:UNKNOWN [Stylonychia lemnae]|uniref:MD-2-related lipid-recognition domain-containing protein n=1 Tax=Stylonychia lemnae TaxID=5949 RepID=A0A078B635_STYLE|nr:UNKNOWN [Stylonychia lemnae]|eukprot:CDW88973.1 UNKNOWN [Stylonychia lemnae]
MNKVILLLIGLVASVSAAHKLEISAAHFLKAARNNPFSFVKGYLSASHPNLQGPVTWGTCASDGGFKVDLTQTHSDPTLPIKGKDVTLDLDGTFTDDAEVDGVNVFVTWNKTPLYTNDFPRKNPESAGDPYEDKITWNIPSFAPSGHYSVQVRVHDGETKPKNYGCITADFDL